jgi:pyruvate/2-oxoglutarate/acetoin dehydrogenase E1 component
VERVTGLDTPIPYAEPMYHTVIPNPDWIVAGVKKIM